VTIISDLLLVVYGDGRGLYWGGQAETTATGGAAEMGSMQAR